MTRISDFERIAIEIADRAADLLSTDVTVVDQHGCVVASSCDEPADAGYSFCGHGSNDYVRIPLHLDSRTRGAIVARRAGKDVSSANIAQVLLDMLIDQIARTREAPSVPEVKDRFIHKLLSEEIEDEESILREAQILGMDLTSPRAVILIDAAGFIRKGAGSRPLTEMEVRRRAQLMIASTVGFFTLPNDTICGYVGNGELVVLKASSTRDLAPWTRTHCAADDFVDTWANLSALSQACDALLARLRRDTNETVTIGVGRYHPGISGLSRSYQDARAALSLGRHFHGENRVHCLNNVGLPAFVGVDDVMTKYDLADYLLGPLDHEPELIHTLETFFAEDCCPSSTGKFLSIHRNTVSYRLQKITSLIGLNPAHFDDAVQIRLALALRSLRHHSD